MFKSLHDFVADTPNATRCAYNVAAVLREKGFVALYENEHWDKPTKDIKGIYVIRGGSIIAITLPDKLKGFRGTLTHSDSPHFKIKARPEIVQNGYTKLNVEPYGGAIYYSWLDKPLSICGSIIDGCRRHIKVDTGSKYQVFIPSQAIHINRDTNSSNSLNPQKDMLPVWSLSKDEFFIEKVSCDTGVIDGILACDLSLYNPEPVKTVKLGYSEVVMGPRLDNLSSVYSALKVFGDDNEECVNGYAQVFVAFNSEEIGSATFEGADGNFLTSVLERVCNMYDLEKYPIFANSMFLSIDAAHAIHPNAPEKSDPTNVVKLDGGIVIKHNTNYANTIGLEACIYGICKQKGIKMQHFYSRSDMRCGATLGNISMSHHGIATLDIGIPMLAMHSAVETISMYDTYELEKLLTHYYKGVS